MTWEAAEASSRYYGERLGGGGVLVTLGANAGGLAPEEIADVLYRNGGHDSKRACVSTY